MTPRARVIIATYNQIPFLRLVLRGYLRQTTNDFTLVLADDGSGEEQISFLREWRPRFEARGISMEHVWHPDEGWRKNHIMNEAVRRSGGETLLVFSDADCIPPAHFVERHLEVHEPFSFHVAGAVRWSREISEGIGEEEIDSGSFEEIVPRKDQRALRIRARKSRFGTLVRRRNRPKVIGLNMAFDRQLFEAVNGFDEVFRWPYFGEDSDLRDRVMKHRPRPRVKVLYTRNDVYHLWHPPQDVRRNDHRAYYNQRRPVRCVQGLVAEPIAET